MQKLDITSLRPTPTVLQLADSSIVHFDGMIEDVVTLDSWEYLADFMILSPKATLGGYPVILGIPWLATTDSYIACWSGDMTISYGNTTKTLALYSPTQPQLDQQQVIWPNVGE